VSYLEGMFDNPVRLTDSIPVLVEGQFEMLTKAYRKKRMLIASFVSVLVLLATSVPWFLLQLEEPTQMWIGIAFSAGGALLGCWVFAVAHYGYQHMGYLIRRHDVSMKRGWLLRTRTTVLIARIQHSEIYRGPLDRWLGLSTVKIFTAGSSGSNLNIPGLSDPVAQAIRSALIDQENHG